MGPMFLLLLATTAQEPEELVLLSLSAARSGDAVEVRALLAAGTDVNGTDHDGRTALMMAAGRNDQALVELLLDAGADAGQRDIEGVSALTIAKADGFRDIVALLRDAGASESQEELLDEAVRAGDLDAVERLLDQGVDINALDTDAYQTPLMTALELRELEIFLRLVRAGADPTREGTGIKTTGENAISVAARARQPVGVARAPRSAREAGGFGSRSLARVRERRGRPGCARSRRSRERERSQRRNASHLCRVRGSRGNRLGSTRRGRRRRGNVRTRPHRE